MKMRNLGQIAWSTLDGAEGGIGRTKCVVLKAI